MATANAATPSETPAEETKSRSKKGLVIGALAVLLLGGGAAWYLGRDAASTAEPKAAPRAPAQYVALDPPFVVNFDSGNAARFLQVTVQLMTRDLLMVDFLKAHDPVIRNDLLLLLGNQNAAEVATREGKETLRLSALESVRRIVESEGGDPQKLEAVYFTSFVMQ
jgi:flagellar FliL protein